MNTDEGTRDLTPGLPGAPFLGVLSSLVLLPVLESQRLLLRWYLTLLEDPSLRKSCEEQASALARAFMQGYLDLVKSQPERSERLVRMQADAVKSCLDALESAVGRLQGPAG